MIKLALIAGKNQSDSKKMASPLKEVEDSEDEEMSEDEDDESSGEEVVIPQKKGKKATTTPPKKMMFSPTKKVAVATLAKKAVVTSAKQAAATPAKKTVTPAKAVVTPDKKGATQAKHSIGSTSGKKGAAAPAKGAKNGKNAKNEDSDEDEDDSEEEDDDDEEEDESDEIKEVFEDAVEIRLVSKDGKSKGIAYIEFKTEGDAEKTLEEKWTRVDVCQDHRDGKNSTWSGESKPLVLSNLSSSAMEDTLQEVFEKATHIKVPQNQNGKAKGYTFIEFASFEDAKEALNSCNKREIEGRAIRLDLQGPRGSPNARRQPSRTLFVTAEETFKGLFDGSIQARIVTDRETGSSKGFGFVDFNSKEDAKAAKEAMEDDGFGGRGREALEGKEASKEAEEEEETTATRKEDEFE
uniref:RRM domain-containing protein n=1 Tax=Capra hircus TaxID=9925 RepID=A0A452DPH2_CAPHI